MNIAGCEEFIKDLTETLNDFNIKYCLYGGTLLTIIRDKKLNPDDNDLDFAIFEDIWNKEYFGKLLHAFEKKNIIVSNLAGGAEMHIGRGNVPADLYFYNKKGEFYTFGCHRKHWKIPQKYYDDLLTISYTGELYKKNMNLYVPNYTEEFLDEFYDNNWRVKKPKEETRYSKNWKTVKGPIVKTIKFTSFNYIMTEDIQG